MTNVVCLLFAISIKPDTDTATQAILFDVSYVCYLLSHWIFVSQYFKVSQLMPCALQGLKTPLDESGDQISTGARVKK